MMAYFKSNIWNYLNMTRIFGYVHNRQLKIVKDSKTPVRHVALGHTMGVPVQMENKSNVSVFNFPAK